MKRLAGIYKGEVKKVTYEDIAVGENIFRKITVPHKTNAAHRLKIRRVMRGFDNMDEIPRADPVRLVTQNFEVVADRLGEGDMIFFAGGTEYLHTLLPVILKKRDAVVCVPGEIYTEVNDFFMDKAGAACVFKQKPCTKGKTVVFMPDAQGQDLPDARLVLDLCGNCSGSNVKRTEDLRIRPPAKLMSTGETDMTNIVTMAEYFGIECSNLQVF